MKNLRILALALAFSALAVPAFAGAKKAADPAPAAAKAPEIVESAWSKRCNEKNGKDCEIFKVLQEKNAKSRMAEFAIGIPKDEKLKKGTVRGGIILPLGILLEDGVGMKIDDGKAVGFKIRYCVNAGCIALVNFEKDIVDSMKKGKEVSFFVKSADGKTVRLVMSLKGFGDALKSIE